MAKHATKGSLFNAPGFSFADGVLTIRHGGKITITEAADGSWSYSQGANTYSISAAEVEQITTLHVANRGTQLQLDLGAMTGDDLSFTGKGTVQVTGLAFATADAAADHKFEPNVNLDAQIAAALGTSGDDTAAAVAHFSSLFGEADAIRLVWDYVDDHYSYYDTTINTVAVQLGLIYADYLLDGGAALVDVAKYAPDGSDAGSDPDRVQTLHDNLLGNLDLPSIVDKFFDGNAANGSAEVPYGPSNGSNAAPDEVTGQALIDAIIEVGLMGRPYYGGYEGTDASATRAFDEAHGLL